LHLDNLVQEAKAVIGCQRFPQDIGKGVRPWVSKSFLVSGATPRGATPSVRNRSPEMVLLRAPTRRISSQGGTSSAGAAYLQIAIIATNDPTPALISVGRTSRFASGNGMGRVEAQQLRSGNDRWAVSILATGQSIQFSTLSPGTWRKWRTFRVTTVAS
jgi:hypothetical protein